MQETEIAKGWRARIPQAIALAAFGSLASLELSVSLPSSAYEPLLARSPSLLELAVIPLAGGLGLVSAVQLVAAAAGRGRPAPLARFAPVLVALVAVAVGAAAFHQAASSAYSVVRPLPTATLISFASGGVVLGGLVAASAAWVARESRGALVAPLALLAIGLRVRWLVDNEFDLATIAALQNLMAPPAAALLAIAWLRLERADLARIGVTVFAAADLALAPVAATAAGVALLVTVRGGVPTESGTIPERLVGEVAVGLARDFWVGPLISLLFVAALFYLARRARLGIYRDG